MKAKSIKNYVGLYAIFDNGTVWSYPKIPQNPKGRFLKQSLDHGGYPKVCLRKNNTKKNYSIHRLVAEAFIPNTNKFLQVNHKNGIKTDNRVENLEWCTAKQNINHADKNGLRKYLKGNKFRKGFTKAKGLWR